MGLSRTTKHIQIKYLYVQDLSQAGLIQLLKEDTLKNVADLLTKYLSIERTRLLANELGLQIPTYTIGKL